VYISIDVQKEQRKRGIGVITKSTQGPHHFIVLRHIALTHGDPGGLIGIIFYIDGCNPKDVALKCYTVSDKCHT